MSDDTLRLTDQEVLDHAQTRLAEHLPLEAAGYACTTEDLLKVLLGVATHTGTVESVCADLVGSPSPETIRAYFNEQVRVEDLPDLEARLNAALAAEIPERVRCRACEVAIDLHDQPYYGKTEQAEGLWVRGQAKEGDNAVLSSGQRLGDAEAPARDRGGTRALCRGRRSYRTRYTVHSDDGTAFTAELAVCRVFTTAKRTGRQARKADWVIFILIQLDWPPRRARQQYRRRFGIESSYRCAGQVRGWTTSPNAAYRFLLIGLAFVLLNVWIHLRWLFTQVPRRGGRYLQTKLFELSRLVHFIIRALERHYGCIREIAAPAAPRL